MKLLPKARQAAIIKVVGRLWKELSRWKGFVLITYLFLNLIHLAKKNWTKNFKIIQEFPWTPEAGSQPGHGWTGHTKDT